MKSRDRKHLEEIANAYADVYDGLMNGTIDPKSAGHMLKLLSGGKPSSHQAQFIKKLKDLEVRKEKIRRHCATMLGLDEPERKIK